MRTPIAIALAAALLAGAPLSAQAGKDLAVSIGIAGPGFSLHLANPAPLHYRPAPVVVRPVAPVYYAPPAPVVARPVAPIYYAPPAPVVVRPFAPVYYAPRGWVRAHRHGHAHRPVAFVPRYR